MVVFDSDFAFVAGHPIGSNPSLKSLQVGVIGAFGSDKQSVFAKKRTEFSEKKLRQLSIAVEDDPKLFFPKCRILRERIVRFVGKADGLFQELAVQVVKFQRQKIGDALDPHHIPVGAQDE